MYQGRGGSLFTTTIRRKLLTGAALVLAMLVIVSVASLLGLNSYRQSIRRLEFEALQAPQKAQLVQAIGRLVPPLTVAAEDRAARLGARRAFRARRDAADEELREFRRRADELPPAPGILQQRPVVDSILRGLEESLAELDALAPAAAPDAFDPQCLQRVSAMLQAAIELPDPVDGLSGSLANARTVYRTTLTTVLITSAVGLVLFVGLLAYGYAWIFLPIRRLHEAARRVAQGDFGYRVVLRSRDEMAELAEAFNLMTARFQDVAENLDRQVQERSSQLIRSERLAGVGFLAAGVAHEINNPLSAIAMAAESLEARIDEVVSRLPGDEAQVVTHYVQLIVREAFRCKQITERLLDFSRGRDSERVPTDLVQLTTEVLAMARLLSKYKQKQIEFAPCAPCIVEISPAEIKQVVLNLVANGLDAMQPGGTLRLRVIDQLDHAVLQVQDEGCGLSSEVIDNMFEPFYTSKQAGQGTGLGLSISHQIVSQHGGTISASSAGPGQGATFEVRLPKRAAARPAAA